MISYTKIPFEDLSSTKTKFHNSSLYIYLSGNTIPTSSMHHYNVALSIRHIVEVISNFVIVRFFSKWRYQQACRKIFTYTNHSLGHYHPHTMLIVVSFYLAIKVHGYMVYKVCGCYLVIFLDHARILISVWLGQS